MSVRRFPQWLGGFPMAVATVALATVLLLPFRVFLQPLTVMLLFVPPIMLVARLSGTRASFAAACIAFLALDFLFVPPYYRLTVAAYPEWIGLVVFLAVTLIAGQQTARLRERERAAVQRQDELEFLNRLSFRVASEQSAEQTASFLARSVAEMFGADGVAVYVARDDVARLASAGRGEADDDEAETARAMIRTSGPAPADAVRSSGVVRFLPLWSAERVEGVLVVSASSSAQMDARGQTLSAIGNLAAAALERERLEGEAAHAAALAEADGLKSTLVSSVSHELKTPLAAATTAVTGLLEEARDRDDHRMAAELSAIADDLLGLDSSIGDLLDLSRLESDSWRPRTESAELGDILGTVRSRLPSAQRARVRFALPEGLPEVCVDFGQLARALRTVIENALSYSPAGSEVAVGAQAVEDRVRLWIEDQGPGVAEAERDLIFEKFYRGTASSTTPTGTGLGLTIARELVRANGGTLELESPDAGGARFVIELPSGSCPSEVMS